MNARAVAAGDTFELRYALRPRGGDDDIVSNFDDAEPETVTLGDGTLAPMLEQWLIDLVPGERHVFLLDPWQAFGATQPELVQTLPKTDLPADMVFASTSWSNSPCPTARRWPAASWKSATTR